jgi:hypothetical protein
VILTKEHLTFKSIRKFADQLLSLCSPFVIAALIGCGIVWSLEQAPSQTIVNTATWLQVRSGQNLQLSVPLIVQTTARREVYRMWLTDEQGDIAYQYPDQKVQNAQHLDLSDKQITIPTFIRSGVYILHVEVIYPFNPLKNGTILMSVATLTIQ